MAKFQARHYRVIAEGLRGIASPDQYGVWLELVNHFVKLLREDNPNFQPEKFRKACGISSK